jgi:hypothetical protein
MSLNTVVVVPPSGPVTELVVADPVFGLYGNA